MNPTIFYAIGGAITGISSAIWLGIWMTWVDSGTIDGASHRLISSLIIPTFIGIFLILVGCVMDYNKGKLDLNPKRH